MNRVKLDNKVIVPEKKLDLSKIRNAKKYSLDFENIDEMIDSNKIKQIREHLNMSQTFFARILGVSKKTIEKWEQGKNPIAGTASRLIHILDKRPDVLKYLYHEYQEINGTITEINLNTQPIQLVVVSKNIQPIKEISMFNCEDSVNCHTPIGMAA